MPVEGGDPNAAVQDGIRGDDKGDCDDAVGGSDIPHGCQQMPGEALLRGLGRRRRGDMAAERRGSRGGEGRYIDSLFSLYDTDGVEIYIITEIECR